MESKIKDKTFQQVPIYVKFNGLPRQIRERLIKRMRGEGEGFAFKTAGMISSYILIAATIIWFLLLFFLADDYIWSSFKLGLFGLVSLIAAYFLLHNLYKVIHRLASGAGCYLLITPLYVIDIYFNEVRYWNLEQLVNFNSAHRYQNNSYNFTEITLTLENGSKNLKINNLGTAEDTIEQINYFRKLFIEATVRNDAEYLNSNDDFRELSNQNNILNAGPGSGFLPQILTISVSIILAAGIMFGAILLNNYYDDKRSWNDAQSANRASSYRTYLQAHPQGRWTGDANLRLQTLYDEAEQKYRGSLNKDYDQKAVEAVVQILRYAKTTQNYRVKVGFERYNEVPSDIIEQLKKENEVKNMISMGDAFSDEKMKQRENNLLTLISAAFGQVIPDDILEITSECSDECALFLVKYTINSDNYYYDTRQEKLPENERIYYPGIYIVWNFDVKTPNQPQTYNFELISDPAKEISYDSVSDEDYDPKKDFAEVLKKDLVNIYNSMATSAFDDFKANLIFRMGIGEKPKPRFEPPPESETSPTPKKEKQKTVK